MGCEGVVNGGGVRYMDVALWSELCVCVGAGTPAGHSEQRGDGASTASTGGELVVKQSSIVV